MSESELWIQIKDHLQQKSKGQLLRSVLSSTQMEAQIVEGRKQFTLTVPTAFHQKCIHRVLEDIQTHIKEQGLNEKVFVQKTSKSTTDIPITKSQKITFLKTKNKTFSKNSSDSVFSEWSFMDFVEGPSNTFALAAAKSVAKSPSTKHTNPLFIYGPTGLGKTHLLLAIGNQIKKTQPEKTVYYLAAERFFNDCITHIQKNAMPQFREKYRKRFHVLLLDDVQILGRGESTQEEFFHTFECLIQNNCQVVLASDKNPKDIKGLKDRMRSRFSGGLMVDIQPPDKETSLAIIKQKAKKMKIHLSEPMCFYLAELSSNSIREIEGFLNKIKIFCDLYPGAPLSFAVLRQLFDTENFSNKKTSTQVLTVEQIQQTVANFFHLKPSDIKSRSRTQKIVYARNISMFLVRELIGLSLAQIGQVFGGKDHSSVLKALQKTTLNCHKNSQISLQLEQLKTILFFPTK